MKTSLVGLACLFVGGLMMGCSQINSSQLDQSQIYTSYSASYSETGSQLSYQAIFNVGNTTGTYVDLVSPSSIAVNGNALSRTTDIANQVFYVANLSGVSSNVWQTQQVFTYTDSTGKVYVDTLSIPSAIELTTAGGTVVSKASGITVSWTTANALQSGESLSTILQSSDQGGTQAFANSNPSGTNGSVTFDPASLAQMTTGAATLTICRSTTGISVQAPSVGGSQTVSYCGAQVAVTVAN